MEENELQKLLGKQFLIAAYIESKLQIVNYIKEGYDQNKPILINNRFLHFTAHSYYLSIIVDLYALFGPANANNKNSFKHINSNYRYLLKSESIEIVHEWITKAEENIQIIKNLRHMQIAHYDFDSKEAIYLNFDNLTRINTLFELAKRIIQFYSAAILDKENSTSYAFEKKYHYLQSLERLIDKAAR